MLINMLLGAEVLQAFRKGLTKSDSRKNLLFQTDEIYNTLPTVQLSFWSQVREQRLDDSYVSQQLALGKKKDLFEVAS